MKKTKQTEPSLTFTDEPNAVTVRIGGRAFENLKEITKIFNRWDYGDNKPSDMVERFLCDGDEWTTLDERD